MRSLLRSAPAEQAPAPDELRGRLLSMPQVWCHMWTRCAVHQLDVQTSLALQAADALEGRLRPHLGPGTRSLNIRARIAPLLEGWLSHQLGSLRAWSARIMVGESWQSVTAERGCSRYARPLLYQHMPLPALVTME